MNINNRYKIIENDEMDIRKKESFEELMDYIKEAIKESNIPVLCTKFFEINIGYFWLFVYIGNFLYSKTIRGILEY